MENDLLIPPAGVRRRMFATRLGKILFAYSVIAIAVLFSGILSFVLVAIWYLLALALIMVSLFTLLLKPEFMELVTSGSSIGVIGSYVLQYWYIPTAVAAVCSLFAIILLATDKTKRHLGLVVVSAVVLGVALLYTVAMFAMGGAA